MGERRPADGEAASALDAARRSGLLRRGEPVVVMLSGGRDSVCLLDVAVELCGPEAVSALHVNHGLRDDAGADESHCAALCQRAGVPLEVERLGPAPASGNLHAWARDARYAAAERVAAPRGAAIAAGHTATDQVETVLYRLAASPGRRALLGMAAREGLVVRPLLEVTREETAAHCRARGLPWREDPANEDPSYTRTRVRLGLVPALRAVHPAAEASVLRTARVLREEAEVLDELVDEVLDRRDRIALGRLKSLPPALRRLVVRRLAESATGEPAPIGDARIDELLGLGRAAGGAALDVGFGARAVVESGMARFERTPPAADGS